MTNKLWWEDLHVGRRFTLGSYAVTRDEVIKFATRYDPQPFHIDDVAAAANPVFGRISASGPHTFAMTSRMVFDGFAKHGIVPIAGGGSDEMRFAKPVFPGDTLTATMEIVEARPLSSRKDRGLTRMRMTAQNQHGDMVLSYVATIFFERRDYVAAEGE